MTDRLAQIMAQFGGLALQRMPQDERRALLGDAPPAVARMRAFDALPEAERVALVKAAGAVPPDCGDAIPVAPARGAVRVFDILASYPKGADGSELKPAGHMGRRTMERLDVFGRMAAQSRRRGGDGVLTASQVQVGRLYRTLVEDREAGAVRCTSAEAMLLQGAGGGTREGFTDHRLALSRRIDAMQARIGGKLALRARRVGRSDITARALVDLVCLMDRDLSEVLVAHGWAVDSDCRARLGRALAFALDRMAGIGPRPARIVAV